MSPLPYPAPGFTPVWPGPNYPKGPWAMYGGGTHPGYVNTPCTMGGGVAPNINSTCGWTYRSWGPGMGGTYPSYSYHGYFPAFIPGANQVKPPPVEVGLEHQAIVVSGRRANPQMLAQPLKAESTKASGQRPSAATIRPMPSRSRRRPPRQPPRPSPRGFGEVMVHLEAHGGAGGGGSSPPSPPDPCPPGYYPCASNIEGGVDCCPASSGGGAPAPGATPRGGRPGIAPRATCSHIQIEAGCTPVWPEPGSGEFPSCDCSGTDLDRRKNPCVLANRAAARSTVARANPQSAPIILDVRTHEEAAAIPTVSGATIVPIDELPFRAASIVELARESGAPVLVYCKLGKRAELATKFLKAYGVENVHNIGGTHAGPYADFLSGGRHAVKHEARTRQEIGARAA